MPTKQLKGKFECSVTAKECWHISSIREEVCQELPYYGTLDENDYCILHYPSRAKTSEFLKEIQSRLEQKQYNFGAVWFCDDYKDIEIFEGTKFESLASFRYATFDLSVSFKNAVFVQGADFWKSEFWGADFSGASFYAPLEFTNAHFKGGLTFRNVKFEENAWTHFAQTEFFTADFSGTDFFNVDFHAVKFTSDVRFDSTKFLGDASFGFSSISSMDFFETEFYSHASFHASKISFARFKKTEFKGTASFDSIKVEFIRFDEVDFFEASFKNATFQETNFIDTRFNKKISFYKSTFLDLTYFKECRFQNVSFNFSIFESNSRTIFENVSFNGLVREDKHVYWLLDFGHAMLKGYLYFEGNNENLIFTEPEDSIEDLNLLYFHRVQVESPERICFHTVNLRPSWFADIDSRKINFKNIHWKNADGGRRSILTELTLLNKIKVPDSHNLLAISCRQLATNYDENCNYKQASNFRGMALEIERLARKRNRVIWRKKTSTILESPVECTNFPSESKTVLSRLAEQLKLFPADILHFFYRIFSGYGESWSRAFLWLIAIWIFWAFIYASPFSDFADKQNYGLWYWIGYSLNVITLQRPDPKPANTLTMILIGLEVLVAPIQAALLILAVRRKFMR